MKFPEIFKNFDNEAIRDGKVIFHCLAKNREYIFDYSVLVDKDKLDGESPVETLARIAAANPDCAEILVDENHLLWPVHGTDTDDWDLRFYTQAEWTEFKPGSWAPSIKGH